jgi:ubiquinone/menaquinone biosynthesis C-methylase UbiE
MATIEVRQQKDRVRQQWDDSAAGWKKWMDILEASARPVSETLLDLAGVSEGNWVLDVATGAGEPALAAARRVGPQGKVVAIDVAKRMLAVGEERAKAAGLTNVTFQEGDGESLAAWPEKSYDAVLCRWGLMYMPQLPSALRGILRVLTPRSSLAAAVWGSEERVPVAAAAAKVVGGLITLPRPAPGAPGMFTLSEPGLLEKLFSEAGFQGVRSEHVAVVLELANAQSFVDFVKETTSFGPIIAQQGPHAQEEITTGLVEAAAEFADASGKLTFVSDVVCVVGRRP